MREQHDLRLRPASAASERAGAEGMVAQRRVAGAGVRVHVLARCMDDFAAWVRLRGRKLQDCNYLGGTDAMRGLSFSSPLMELMVLDGWFVGRDGEFVDEGNRLIARYCLDRRVHEVPRDSL